MKSPEVDNYITGFPNDVQNILQRIRNMISELAPEADPPSFFHTLF